MNTVKTTYYVGVSFEMTDDGPQFHMITEENHRSFKSKLSRMPGEVLVQRKKIVETPEVIVPVETVDKTAMLDGVAGAIAEIKKHRGSYMNYKEAEAIFKHLRIIRDEIEREH